MNINRFTQKAQEAPVSSQQIALRNQQFEVQPPHLLQALLTQPEGVIPQVFTRMGVDLQQLQNELNTALSALAKVTGSTGEPQMGRVLRDVLVGAHDEIQQFGDQYVSTEHMLLSLIKRGDPRTQQLLQKHNIT